MRGPFDGDVKWATDMPRVMFENWDGIGPLWPTPGRICCSTMLGEVEFGRAYLFICLLLLFFLVGGGKEVVVSHNPAFTLDKMKDGENSWLWGPHQG